MVKNFYINKDVKNFKVYEIIFAILLLIYLLSDITIPYNWSPYFNNIFMYSSLVAITYLLFLYSNSILALFFAIVSIVFIYRNQQINIVTMPDTQINKNYKLKNLNKKIEKKTLEEQIIQGIDRKPNNIPNPASYHPVLCDIYDATEL